MRIKILLDNDLATDGFMVFYDLWSSILFMIILPHFLRRTQTSQLHPPTFYGICNLGIHFRGSVKG